MLCGVGSPPEGELKFIVLGWDREPTLRLSNALLVGKSATIVNCEPESGVGRAAVVLQLSQLQATTVLKLGNKVDTH